MNSSVATMEKSPNPEFQDKYSKTQKPDEEKFESGQKREEDTNFTKDETTPVISDTAVTTIEQPVRELKGVLWALVVAAVISPFSLFALDNTIVADVQPKVVETQGKIEKLPWMSVAFALGVVSVNLICLGPIIGGAFTDSGATWKWSSYLNLCVGGAGAPVYSLLLPSHDPRPGVSIKTRLRDIDFLGALLIMGASYRYLAGGILSTIGAALMYTIDLNSSTGRIYGYSVILAVGEGFTSQASFSIAQAKVESHQLSAATGFINCAQITGLTISLSVVNSTFLNKATNKISADLPGIDIAKVRGAISGFGGSLFESLTQAQRLLVLNSIADSIKDVCITMIVAGAMTIVCSVFMKRERLFLGSASVA
ncbi:hypothetical protein BCON_0222g00150 [Botryotinia convoluta]|uniref:Major facilitator superfamily (MFS) profile domain-containing protein n=1 Tax=Botryotinia convoluta TaxID=54673 RepID=A0A4Z1HJS2_9HELO|nr:hypothetical protein BCON_0222g00150 [Botryotinia convoluta]